MNEANLRDLMFTAQLPNQGPFSIRYPRGRGVTIDWKTPMKKLEIGKSERVSEGSDVAILSIGNTGNFVINSQEYFKKVGISVEHYNMIFIKPLDEVALHGVFSKFDKIITIEDGCLKGGFGSAILEFMSENNYTAIVKRLGIPDAFIEHGTQSQLYKECLFDEEELKKTVKEIVVEQNISKVG